MELALFPLPILRWALPRASRRHGDGDVRPTGPPRVILTHANMANAEGLAQVFDVRLTDRILGPSFFHFRFTETSVPVVASGPSTMNPSPWGLVWRARGAPRSFSPRPHSPTYLVDRTEDQKPSLPGASAGEPAPHGRLLPLEGGTTECASSSP